MSESSPKYWLMKAEPDTRIVKGKDVKFSVDDFESIRTTPWEGVRNFEARNLMKEMVVGDKVLFYHSNCKNPGIAGFAKVAKEAYPDYTAWDSSHPYFDPKTKQDDPKWFMIDATFIARAKYFVPLALLRHIADSSNVEPPDEIGYIGVDGVQSIKAMPLVARGRLSVQRVDEDSWNVIQTLAEMGGWDDLTLGKKSTTKRKSTTKTPTKQATKKKDNLEQDQAPNPGSNDISLNAGKTIRKRKIEDDHEGDETIPKRRSTRTKKMPPS
ncbi:PUA-like domain-containing protein [Hygrophoropsis aurantiaca]|uniref:PUA-like domain-containing protein n=1 Tax=Hygrophoropsis aurantiaca TaxID=72124 RepID=A0ACB8AWI6_9AGAM|nr:PUA-like domain-containing protein [Hygrophoropsis aurantiaca]